MIKHNIIIILCLWFCIGMTCVNTVMDNLPMTIMWGCISIFEVVIFSIAILIDVNVLEGEE